MGCSLMTKISLLKLYSNTNVSTEISPLILWDCAKAYLRGYITITHLQEPRMEGGNIDNWHWNRHLKG